MKISTLPLFLIAFTCCAQICPPKPPRVAPASIVPLTQACTCNAVGSNCRWIWVQAPRPVLQAPALDPGVLSAIANGPAPVQILTPQEVQARRLQLENLAATNELLRAEAEKIEAETAATSVRPLEPVVPNLAENAPSLQPPLVRPLVSVKPKFDRAALESHGFFNCTFWNTLDASAKAGFIEGYDLARAWYIGSVADHLGGSAAKEDAADLSAYARDTTHFNRDLGVTEVCADPSNSRFTIPDAMVIVAWRLGGRSAAEIAVLTENFRKLETTDK
jgi:hypothetical protein